VADKVIKGQPAPASISVPLKVIDKKSLSKADKAVLHNRRSQRKSASSLFPPVHAADVEGQQRVVLTRSPSRDFVHYVAVTGASRDRVLALARLA